MRALVITAVGPDPDPLQLEDLLKGVDADALCTFAEHHRVVPLVHRRLKDIPGMSSIARDRLGASVLAAQARRLHAQRTLGELRRQLSVPFLAMKGPVLASTWYDDPALREFNDVDILVGPGEFAQAVDELFSAGLRPLARNWHGFLDHEVAEIPLGFETSMVDLHWDVVALGKDRRELHLPSEDLMSRGVFVEVGGQNVLTFDPADTLLHLCVNTGLGGARRLRGLVDIDTVLRTGRVDQQVLAERATNAGAARLCSAVLQRARSMLGTPVPDDLLSTLTPARSWLAANDFVDRRRRDGSDPKRGLASGLLLAAGRRSRIGTMRALTRSVFWDLAARTRLARLSGAGGALDWRRTPADGDVEGHRQRYLAWVTNRAARRDRRRPLAVMIPGRCR